MIVHCCHCLNCQRQTGSAFVINLLIEADRLEEVAGTAQPVDVPRDDGSVQRIFRCPQCQIALFSKYGPREVRFVRGGTLDDPTDIAPDVHIYTRSKVGWVTIPQGTPAFEGYYNPKQLWSAESLPGSKRFSPVRSVARYAALGAVTPQRHRNADGHRLRQLGRSAVILRLGSQRVIR